MTHGYMLSGSGSNVYVQNLCRALAREGHEVHLLCQEPRPLAYDFVDEHYRAGEAGIRRVGVQKTAYPGRCVVYNPDIGDLLPVYVYDEYPGWRVKTFLDLTEEEFGAYVGRNVAAVRAVLAASGSEAVVTNHAVPGPSVARRALAGTGSSYVSIVHGSALQYVARKSAKYFEVAREGLGSARRVLALSAHSAGTVTESFPELSERVGYLPGGVDTELFRPEALDLDSLSGLYGGSGRGPEQAAALRGLLEKTTQDAAALAAGLGTIAASYDARAHDRDAGHRLKSFLAGDAPVVLFVGKLIHSKGVHSLLSAFARIHRLTGARLVIIGFGTFREALEALVLTLGAGDTRTTELLAAGGRLFEGGPAGHLEHFHPTRELFRAAAGIENSVAFVGPLGHEALAKLLPAADVAVVPSIFPESFGLVAAEFAASGVIPFVADHSGLREAGGIVGRGLPFDLRVGLDGFEEGLERALTDYLQRPARDRQVCAGIVRSNSVEYLGWDKIAARVAALAGSGD